MFENFDWINAMRTSPVMVVILGCSILTFGYAFERLVFYGRRRKLSEKAVAETLERARKGDVKDAAHACGSLLHPFGPVAAELLRGQHLPADVQEERLSIALSEQRMRFERNLGWLGTMGNTAPLIGLLGTVWGIMRAVHDMARTGSAGPSVVAVPAVMLYNHFLRAMSVMLTEAENHARHLRQALDERTAEARAHHHAAA